MQLVYIQILSINWLCNDIHTSVPLLDYIELDLQYDVGT